MEESNLSYQRDEAVQGLRVFLVLSFLRSVQPTRFVIEKKSYPFSFFDVEMSCRVKRPSSLLSRFSLAWCAPRRDERETICSRSGGHFASSFFVWGGRWKEMDRCVEGRKGRGTGRERERYGRFSAKNHADA